VWAREEPLTHDGDVFTLPLPPGQGTGLGKALKIIGRPVRSEIPIWVASLGEKNVALTAEVANGWLPMLFIPEKMKAVWGSALDEGQAKRDPSLGPLSIAAGGLLAIGDGPDVLAVRQLSRSSLALYIGGMGAKGRNFYNDVARRSGYEDAAEKIQDLYLSGQKAEAEAAVPEELLELTSLCGPAGHVAERIAALAEAGVTHLQVTPVPVGDQRPVDLIEQVKELAG
jgi:F420-dependent oxidoreductase-like protein